MTQLVGNTNAAQSPYSAVVYVTADFADGTSFSGSGVMVGRNDILTAAHVIFDADHGGLATNVTVYPGADGGHLPFGAGFVQSISYFEIYTDSDGLLSADDSGHDLALLGITAALGDQTGLFDITAAPATANYHLTGYPGLYADSSGPRMTDDTGTAYTDGTYPVVFYRDDLESNPGNSGGPLWYTSGGVNQVTGLVSTTGWAVELGQYQTLLDVWINQNDYLLNVATEYDQTLIGDSTGETLAGSDGIDLIRGNEGNDQIRGGVGNDVIYGNAGNDIIYGNQGSDFIRSGAGSNLAFGGQQNDQIIGGDDADISYGNFQNDYLQGSGGNDILWGGQNNDTVQGDSGNDTLFGNRGDDTLIGGTGADRFQFNWSTDQWHDVIIDFKPADGDQLVFQGISLSSISWSYDHASGQTIFTDNVVHALLEIDGPTRLATQIGSGTNQVALVGDFSSSFASGWPDFITGG